VLVATAVPELGPGALLVEVVVEEVPVDDVLVGFDVPDDVGELVATPPPAPPIPSTSTVTLPPQAAEAAHRKAAIPSTLMLAA